MRNYRILTWLLSPLIHLWIYWRLWQGKEERTHLRERFGHASQPRSKGTLFWLHAASVGEANSILPLIQNIRGRWPQMQLLLTTGTVTSAKLMRRRLPAGVIHQYVPIDTPGATERFICHWRPHFAFWVESDFWPNLLYAANRHYCFMGIVNGRMSERSYRNWQKRPAMIKRLMGMIDIAFAQSEADGGRLRNLGVERVYSYGNVKYDAAPLPCDETELLRLQKEIGDRPIWLAASTHEGEEALIIKAQAELVHHFPSLLTMIVPRHPARGSGIAALITKSGGNAVLRSTRQSIEPTTQFYIGDTLAELGLFYRLSEIVFMGGSLVPHGGQNPLEPARLSCAIITGTHTHNFSDMYAAMERMHACLRAENAAALTKHVTTLLGNAEAKHALQDNAASFVKNNGGATERILSTLSVLFELKGKTSENT